MAISYGILGQTGDAITEQDLYTVPAATSAKIRITVNNRDSTAATFRVAIVPNGGVTANEDYIAFDKIITPNESITSVPFTVNDADVIRGLSSTSDVTFIVYGIEQV